MILPTHVRRHLYSLVLGCLLALGTTVPATALGSPAPEQSNNVGMQGTISSPPPQAPASITAPANDRSFTATPITITGLCQTGLLVKVFSNGVFVGAAQCTNGSYSLQIDLFSGRNELVVRVYDALDQAGPDSNKVAVTFNDGTPGASAYRLSLTSTIAKMGAPVGGELKWPIVISGGSGPYAVSVDWGDGTASDIKSLLFAGSFDVTHTYKAAGVYRVIVRASDASGTVAYLQLVGVGTGPVSQATGTTQNKDTGQVHTRTVYVWWPMLAMIPLIFVAFWLGARYELVAIHRRIEQQTKVYTQ